MRVRLAAVAAVAILALVAVLALRDPLDGKTQFAHEGTPSFTVLYDGAQVDVTEVPGALFALRGERKGLVATLTVTSLQLPAYEGEPAGRLPVFADNYVRRTEPRARVTVDTRARVNGSPGYEMGLDLGDGATATLLFLVPADRAGLREGVILRFDERQPPARDRGGGRRVSVAMRSALRSFEFGADRD